MKTWQKVLLTVVVVLGVGLAAVFVTRAINQQRYYKPVEMDGLSLPQFDTSDPKAYPLDAVAGVTITPITGEHLSGFYFKPERRTRSGITISYGGSGGNAGWETAIHAAELGQESLALFFWGQPNQTAFLDQVPLEDFQEVIDWVDEHAESSKPMILAGGSKGAEYVANLLPRYDRIDHAILVAPGSYCFPALGPQFHNSSWSYQGKPVPHVDWSVDKDWTGQQNGEQTAKLIFGFPLATVSRYEGMLNYAPEEARIRIEDSKATIHAYAGDQDQLWPSAKMANQLKEAAPDRVTVTIYEGAGHSPGTQRYVGALGGLDLGGSNEANAAAGKQLEQDIRAQIAEWAPEE